MALLIADDDLELARATRARKGRSWAHFALERGLPNDGSVQCCSGYKARVAGEVDDALIEGDAADIKIPFARRRDHSLDFPAAGLEHVHAVLALIGRAQRTTVGAHDELASAHEHGAAKGEQPHLGRPLELERGLRAGLGEGRYRQRVEVALDSDVGRRKIPQNARR